MKDKIYKKKQKPVAPFSFNKNVARSFDDMAERSIPCYVDIQSMIARIALDYFVQGTRIYDIGCSTGNTVAEIHRRAKYSNPRILPAVVAVDMSDEMIFLARKKCRKYPVEWLCQPAEEVVFQKSSVVIATYVLQFVDQQHRRRIIKGIYRALIPGGVFILSEKIENPDKRIDGLERELYNEFKLRNRYSRLEIDQKADALKDVLIPWSQEEYCGQLLDAGFGKIHLLLKYLNFITLIAEK